MGTAVAVSAMIFTGCGSTHDTGKFSLFHGKAHPVYRFCHVVIGSVIFFHITDADRTVLGQKLRYRCILFFLFFSHFVILLVVCRYSIIT